MQTCWSISSLVFQERLPAGRKNDHVSTANTREGELSIYCLHGEDEHDKTRRDMTLIDLALALLQFCSRRVHLAYLQLVARQRPPGVRRRDTHQRKPWLRHRTLLIDVDESWMGRGRKKRYDEEGER